MKLHGPYFAFMVRTVPAHRAILRPINMQTSKSRQEPLSCQLCRSKKLRCNRVQPCSNCQARNIPCHFLNPPSRNQRGRTAPTGQITDEILERLTRLESIVLHKADELPDSPVTSGTPQSSNSAQYSDLHLLENIGVRQDSLVCLHLPLPAW